MKKRFLSAALALVLVVCLVPAASTEAEAVKHTQAEAVVAKAMSYAKSGESVGVMCAGMICKAAKAVGVDSTQMNLSARYATPFVGTKQFGFITSTGDLKYGCTVYTWKDAKEGRYTPQVGDLVFYGYMTAGGGTANMTVKELAKNGKFTHTHVGLIRSNDSTITKLYTVDGGQNSTKDPDHWTYVKTKTRNITKSTGYAYTSKGKKVYVMEFVRPNYKVDYSVELLNNYSGKNYMPEVAASTLSDTFFSRDTSIATVSIDPAEPGINGSNSLKIVNTAAGSSGKDLAFVTHASGRAADGAYCSEQKMTLSFWAKASSPGTQMLFRWGYEGSYRSVTLTDEWMYYSVTMDRTTAVNNYMHPYVDRAGTVWLSCIQLEEGDIATNYASENGGTLKTLTATSGGKYSGLPTPTRDYYIFDGWYTKAKGGTLVENGSSVLKGDTKLYAHWRADTVYTTVSGKVKSCGSETDEVRIELYREGEDTPAYSTTVTGCNAEFSFPSVQIGTYTAKFYKPNHFLTQKTFTVGTEPVTIEANLPIVGDVNLDGYVNNVDAAMVYAYHNGRLAFDDFQLLVGDANCDGPVNVLDAAVIYAFNNGKLTRFPGWN